MVAFQKIMRMCFPCQPRDGEEDPRILELVQLTQWFHGVLVASLGSTALLAVLLHPAWVDRTLTCLSKLWAAWMLVFTLHACEKTGVEQSIDV